MKFNHSYGVIGLTLLAALVVGIAATRSIAMERIVGQNVTLPSGKTVLSDLMIAGANVLIQAPVHGDVMAAGADVTVDGAVDEDALLAGGTVTVNGTVGDDLRAAGGNVTVNNSVRDGASLAGGSVTLASAAKVGGDVDVAGGSIKVLGRVGRRLSLAGGESILGGTVGGSVEARVEKLSLLPGAVVRGDLTVYSPAPPVVPQGAKVQGKIVHHPVASRRQAPSAAERVKGVFLGTLLRFLWLFVLGAALLALIPIETGRIAAVITDRVGPSALAGLAFLILTPILGLLLLVTVVGLPLGVLVLAAYVALLIITGSVFAYRVGNWVMGLGRRPNASPYGRMALGALLVALCMSLPWVGGLFRLIVVVLGGGALILERWELLKRLRAEGTV